MIRYVGLAAIVGRASEGLVAGVTQATIDLEAQCKAATPVDTGTLRASIHHTVKGAGPSVTGEVSTGGESSDYAIFVEQGTSKMAARRYMSGPLLANASLYAAVIERAVNGRL